MSHDVNIETVIHIFADIMPFDKSLGLTPESFHPESDSIEFPMRETLMGNMNFNILHGGAIAAMMDVTGGFVVCLQLARKIKTQSRRLVFEKTRKVGTIDLRIDYLRPGRGNQFFTSGRILRMGNRVSVVRMEMHNDEQKLIAVGTGAYSLG